jgi:hypothetical protein
MRFTTVLTTLALLSGSVAHPTAAHVPAPAAQTSSIPGDDVVRTMPIQIRSNHPAGCCCCSQCTQASVLARLGGHNHTMTGQHSCAEGERPPGCRCSHCMYNHPSDCSCNMCVVQRHGLHAHECTGHPNISGSMQSHDSPRCHRHHTRNLTLHSTTSNITTNAYTSNQPPSRHDIILAISIAAAGFSFIAAFTILFVVVQRRRRTVAKGKGKAVDMVIVQDGGEFLAPNEEVKMREVRRFG